MIVIDASGQVLGRLASEVSKLLLSGEAVNVINAEKAVVVGKPEMVLGEFKQKRARGDPYHGPFYPRVPDRVIKRTVRGMLPYKTPRGMEAFKRLKVFISIPSEFSGKDVTVLKGTADKGEQKSITLGEIAERI